MASFLASLTVFRADVMEKFTILGERKSMRVKKRIERMLRRIVCICYINVTRNFNGRVLPSVDVLCFGISGPHFLNDKRPWSVKKFARLN